VSPFRVAGVPVAELGRLARAGAIAAWVGLALPLLPAAPAIAAEDDGLRLALHFDDTELGRIVAAIGEATGASFVFDERLQGRVTLHVPRRVTREEALEILNVALRLRGFVAAPSPGGAFRIVPRQDLPAVAPWRSEPTRGESPLTTIVDLRHAAAESIVQTLTPLVGSAGLLAVVPSTRTLVLAGAGADIHRLLQIVSALDAPDGDALHLFRPRFRSVGELLSALEPALASSFGRRQPKLVAIDHGNTLVVIGAPETVARARRLLEDLDRPPESLGEIHVVRLGYADAEDLAGTLAGLATGGRGVARTAAAATTPDGAMTLLEQADWSAIPHLATNALLLRGSPEVLRELTRVIGLLDLPPTLIRVDAQILELQSAQGLDLAFDSLFTGSFGSNNDGSFAVQSVTSGSGALLAGEAPGRILSLTRDVTIVPGADGQPVAIAGDQIALLAEQREVRSRTLLEPQLTLLSGDESEIAVGDNIPVPVQSSQPDGTVRDPLQTSVEIQRQDVSTLLRVRATSGQQPDSPIRLEVTVESSALAPSLAGNVELVGPTIRTRRLTATLTLEEGELKLIGGRALPSIERRELGVPYLRRVPVLGWAFRSESTQRVETMLLVAVRARTLRDPGAVEADAIRSRLAFERHLASLAPLRERANGPWALHVAMVEADECEAVAGTVPVPAERVATLPRNAEPGAACDIYIIDFAELGHAARAAERLSLLGWNPRLVAVPE